MNIQPIKSKGIQNVATYKSTNFKGRIPRELRKDVFIAVTPLEKLQNATGVKFGEKPILTFSDPIDKIQENLLTKYNIRTDFNGNRFVANCTQNAANLMGSLIGVKHLPDEVRFLSFSKHFKKGQNARSYFTRGNNGIYINSDNPYYTNLDALTKERKKGHHIFFDDEFSTYNPLHGFIHDFSHAAHHKNLQMNKTEEAWDYFTSKELSDYEFAKQGGKMGKWAKTNLVEYMAEAITKDVLDETKRVSGRDLMRYEGKGKVQSILPDNRNDGKNFNTYNIWMGNTGIVKFNMRHREEMFNPQYIQEEGFFPKLNPETLFN